MKFLRTLLAAAALVAFSVPTFAQDKDKDNDRDRMANQTSITGCLTKADTGEWMIADQSGAQLTVVSKEDFSKHANHTVKLTGAPSADGKSFNATKLEHVADSCQAK
jgi:peptidoglycan biosynthesis protein MviN/MurJ (putative lipid II flippase)